MHNFGLRFLRWSHLYIGWGFSHLKAKMAHSHLICELTVDTCYLLGAQLELQTKHLHIAVSRDLECGNWILRDVLRRGDEE